MMRLIIGKLRDMMRKNFSFTSKSGDSSSFKNSSDHYECASFQEIQAEFGSFDRYLWNFVDQQPSLITGDRRGSSLHGIIATD